MASLCLSIEQYAMDTVQFWTLPFKKDMDKLESVQRKVSRMLMNLEMEMLSDLGTLKGATISK